MKIKSMSFSIILFFNLIFNLIVAQSFNVYANTFKTVLPFGPDTLNPYTSSFNNSSRKIRSYIHESLLDRDLESNEFIPRLAVSWEISPNHREIIFNLRKNVLFSDGSKLSASDVKFSFESLFNDSYQAALLRTPFELIEKCEILNDYQIKFTSKKADYYQFQNLALELKILSKKFYENLSNQKNFHQKLIGTGPYLLKDVEVNTKITLFKNDQWWGNQDLAYQKMHQFSKIEFKIIKDPDIQLIMLQKGQLDFLRLNPAQFDILSKNKNKNFILKKVKNFSTRKFTALVYQLNDHWLQDQNVRLSIDLLINRPFMMDKYELNLSGYVKGPSPSEGLYESSKIEVNQFNPKKAAQILKDSGFADTDQDGILDKNKIPLEINILNSTQSQNLEKYLTTLQEDAKKIGVKINIQTMDWNSINTLLDERKFQAVFLGLTEGSVDWNPANTFHSKSQLNKGNNFFNYKNQKVDLEIDQLSSIFDPQLRKNKLTLIYELIAKDQVMSYFFSPLYEFYAVNPKIKVTKETMKFGIGSEFWSY